MLTDIQIGDEVRVSYMVFGTQVLSWGTVIEEIDKDTYVIVLGTKEVEVTKSNIIERKLRASEIKDTPVTKVEEDSHTTGVVGIKFKRKRNYESKTN